MIDLCRKYGGQRWSRKNHKPLDIDIRPVNVTRAVSPHRKAMLKEFMKPDNYVNLALPMLKLPYNLRVKI